MAPSKVWSESETISLIELYGEYYAELEKMKKKKPIFIKIVEKMTALGYNRCEKQVTKYGQFIFQRINVNLMT